MDDDEMSREDFVRANFFSSDADFETAKQAGTAAPEFVAVEAFVQALDEMQPRVRQAWIAWLADRYSRRKDLEAL